MRKTMKLRTFTALAARRSTFSKSHLSGDATVLGYAKRVRQLALLTLLAFTVAPAMAQNYSGLNLGTAANYAFVDTGATTLGWNSGPIAGSVLFGNNLNAQLSGGNNGGLTNGGVLYYDSTVKLSGSLQNQPTETQVSTSVTQAATASAQSVSAYASSLAATQTFSTINNTTTIIGNGGLNVIDVGSIQNANITFSGTANDVFVINVTGTINTNQVMALAGGVTAGHILFNMTGTSGNILQTSGGDTLVGTFLAVDGGQFQFSELNLNGALINTDGNVQFVSGSKIPTFTPFAVPEPGSAMLFVGGACLFFWKRSRHSILRVA